jgi:tetratricopeptide (TPR) repeat protein
MCQKNLEIFTFRKMHIVIMNETPMEIVNSYDNFGNQYSAKGEFYEAEKFYLKSLLIRGLFLSNTHCGLIISYKCLLNLYVNQRNYDRAEKFCLKCIKSIESASTENRLDLKDLNKKLDEIHSRQRSYEKEEEFYSKRPSIQETVLVNQHPYFEDSENSLLLLEYCRKEDFKDCTTSL